MRDNKTKEPLIIFLSHTLLYPIHIIPCIYLGLPDTMMIEFGNTNITDSTVL